MTVLLLGLLLKIVMTAGIVVAASVVSAAFALSFFSSEFWASMATLLRPLGWPFALGSTLGALILAAISYNLAWPAIAAGRRRLHLRDGTLGDAR